MSLFLKSARLPTPSEALPGRDRPIPTAERHAVLGTPLAEPFPAGCEAVLFGMGCFWGAERLFWRVPGVYTTSVGYAGGFTPHPTYEEVCTGQTGHAEVVQVVFDPARVDFEELLRLFWESHDPTQGMRQGNDVGTQYRSVICTTTDGQLRQAEASRRRYQAALNAAGGRTITTEIWPSASYYLAEEYHQQYLHKNPNGYCGLAGCGISYR